MQRRYAVALGIAFLVAVLAPLLASSNPDGLEKTAEKFESAQGRETELLSSPFTDYTVPGMPGAASEIVAMIIGTALVFVLTLGVVRALMKAG